MLPYILMIGGALVLFGGGKSSSGKKKSGNSGGGNTVAGTMMIANIDTMHPIKKEPWERCKPPAGSPPHTYAAYGQDLKCMVFWRPDTWNTVITTIQLELSKLPKKERDALCSADECEPDPYSIDPELFCKWTVDPKREAFIQDIILKLYPQLRDANIPPTVSDPYFPKMVYTLTAGTFAEHFCGFNLTT